MITFKTIDIHSIRQFFPAIVGDQSCDYGFQSDAMQGIVRLVHCAPLLFRLTVARFAVGKDSQAHQQTSGLFPLFCGIKRASFWLAYPKVIQTRDKP